MNKGMNDYQACFIFSFITLCIGCIVFYNSTVASDSKINYYIWGSLMCIFSLCLFVAGTHTRQEYVNIKKFGTVLDAVIRLRTENPKTFHVNLIVTYTIDEQEVTNMLLDSFDNSCPLGIGDRVKVKVYNGKALLIDEEEHYGN